MKNLCINPRCPQPENIEAHLFCQACGSELLLAGRYRVLAELGGGGFGKTYEVGEAQESTPKVLKILMNHDAKSIELFQREAEVLEFLTHPGIPKVEPDGYFIYHARNSDEAIHCLVMEKIVGMDLNEYLRNRNMQPITQKRAVQWLTEVTQILDEVHRQQFFHRDIKPANIMLRSTGPLALIDFGTVRQISGTYMAKQGAGQVTGVISAGYTSPEQLNGQATPQSDFFALARTMVFLLTGEEPANLYDPHTDEVMWRDRVPDLNPAFAELIDDMMARALSKRPKDTQTLLQRLAQVQQAVGTKLTSTSSSLPETAVNAESLTTPPPFSSPPHRVSPGSVPPGSVPPQSIQPHSAQTTAQPIGPVSNPGSSPRIAASPYNVPPLPVQPYGSPLQPLSSPPQTPASTASGLPQKAFSSPTAQKNFLIFWIGATVLGHAISWGISPKNLFLAETIGDSFLAWIIVGALVGIAQWIVLSRKIRQCSWWTVATALGISTVFIFSVLRLTFGWSGIDNFSTVLGGSSLILAIGQYFVIREQLWRSWLWPLVSAGSFFVAVWFVTYLLNITNIRPETPVIGVLAGILVGLIQGGISAKPLVWLIGRSRAK